MHGELFKSISDFFLNKQDYLALWIKAHEIPYAVSTKYAANEGL